MPNQDKHIYQSPMRKILEGKLEYDTQGKALARIYLSGDLYRRLQDELYMYNLTLAGREEQVDEETMQNFMSDRYGYPELGGIPLEPIEHEDPDYLEFVTIRSALEELREANPYMGSVPFIHSDMSTRHLGGGTVYDMDGNKIGEVESTTIHLNSFQGGVTDITFEAENSMDGTTQEPEEDEDDE
jgi:hypothetical protein